MKQLLESKDNCKAYTFETTGKKYMMSGKMGFLTQTSSITSNPLAYSNSVQTRMLTSVLTSKLRPETQPTVVANKPGPTAEVEKPQFN